MDAVVHRPGEGERLEMGPNTLVIHASGETTAGTMYLGESTIAPDFAGPPPHTHQELHDMFYVLEGTLTVQVGEETLEAGAGTFIGVPPGVVHTFRNESDAHVRILNFNTPAWFENYMRDLAAASKTGPPTQAQIGEIASRYDFHRA